MRDANMPNSDLLRIEEVAAVLRIQPSTVRSWVLKRKIPYCKCGRLVRVKRADVEALIERSVVPAADREQGL